MAKFLEQSRKDKEKKIKEYRQNTIGEQKKQTLAIGSNTINAIKKIKNVTSVKSYILTVIK